MAIGTPRRWCVVLDDGIVQFYVSFMAGRCDAAHPRRADPTVLFRRPPSPRTLQTLSRSRRYEKVSEARPVVLLLDGNAIVFLEPVEPYPCAKRVRIPSTPAGATKGR
jgi:hypothetical protein